MKFLDNRIDHRGRVKLSNELFNYLYDIWEKGDDIVKQQVRPLILENFSSSDEETKSKHMCVKHYIERSPLLDFIRTQHNHFQSMPFSEVKENDIYKRDFYNKLEMSLPNGTNEMVHYIIDKIIGFRIYSTGMAIELALLRNLYMHYIKGQYVDEATHRVVHDQLGEDYDD